MEIILPKLKLTLFGQHKLKLCKDSLDHIILCRQNFLYFMDGLHSGNLDIPYNLASASEAKEAVTLNHQAAHRTLGKAYILYRFISSSFILYILYIFNTYISLIHILNTYISLIYRIYSVLRIYMY